MSCIGKLSCAVCAYCKLTLRRTDELSCLRLKHTCLSILCFLRQACPCLCVREEGEQQSGGLYTHCIPERGKILALSRQRLLSVPGSTRPSRPLGGQEARPWGCFALPGHLQQGVPAGLLSGLPQLELVMMSLFLLAQLGSSRCFAGCCKGLICYTCCLWAPSISCLCSTSSRLYLIISLKWVSMPVVDHFSYLTMVDILHFLMLILKTKAKKQNPIKFPTPGL